MHDHRDTYTADDVLEMFEEGVFAWPEEVGW
jgi:hypothetical protein